ncbi:MAG: HAMP domain-containing protein [Elusimicrobia bacterium]|nr:HAMP domain-containing protein [Elusimicrobiota bacterium]
MKSASFFSRIHWAHGFLAGAYLLSLLGLYLGVSNEETSARRSLALAAYSNKIHAAALSCRRLLKFSQGRGSLAQAAAARRETSLLLAQSRSAARDKVTSEESAELDKLSRFVHASGTLLGKISRLKRQGRAKEASVLYETGLRPIVEGYMASSVEERLRGELALRIENRRGARLWTRVSLGAAVAFAVLTCLVFWLWTRRLVDYASRNVERVRRALSALKSGDFRVTIEPDRSDELGALCTNLKSLAARLDRAQGRLDAVTQLANESSHAINQVVFAVSDYVALARRKRTLEPDDEHGLLLILERTARCNLLLGRLCELVAGQKLLSEDSPTLHEAVEDISGYLHRGSKTLPPPPSDRDDIANRHL